MDKIKLGYIAGELWSFIQLHNLLPVIVAFCIGWYVAYTQTANLQQFKMEMQNENYQFKIDVIRTLDKIGTVNGVATAPATLKPVPTKTPTPTPRLIAPNGKEVKTP